VPKIQHGELDGKLRVCLVEEKIFSRKIKILFFIVWLKKIRKYFAKGNYFLPYDRK